MRSNGIFSREMIIFWLKYLDKELKMTILYSYFDSVLVSRRREK